MSDMMPKNPDQATLEEVFQATLYTWMDWVGVYDTVEEARVAFNRTIDKVKAEAAAEALEQAAAALLAEKGVTFADALMNRWLIERADRIRCDAGLGGDDS